MRVCQCCVLPETFPRIKFDENGKCNICHKFEDRYRNIDYKERQKELSAIIEKAKRKQREYDCMVPLSGGRDSSMVLYLASKIFGMKVLAFNYDNGFFTDQARKNMEVLTRALNVDFISYRPKVSRMMKAYRIAYLKTGDFCIPCNRGVTAGVYKTAFDRNIPLIMLGYCSKTDGIPREVEIFDQRLMKDVFKGEMDSAELNTFLFPDVKRLLIPRINVPDYFDWKETENFKKLTEEFTGSNYSGDVHFDCTMSGVADYIKRKKWNFGKKELKYSVYIRDGIMTRDEALQKLAAGHKEPPELEEWMKCLGIDREAFQEGLKRSHAGFKSYNFKILKFLRKHTKLVSFPLEDDD